MAETNFWDERYNEDGFAYGDVPNVFFKDIIDSLHAGKILLPAEGEGRNAVYAARLAWSVTAFDSSKSGRKKAMQLAKKHKVTLDYQLCSASDFSSSKKFDAIGLFFFHLPPALRKEFHQKCVEMLAPGGTLIIEAFNPKQLHFESGGPKQEELLFSAALLKDDFKDLDIVFCKEQIVRLDEGKYHVGEAAVVRLLATKLK